jgi:hypothetical protein
MSGSFDARLKRAERTLSGPLFHGPIIIDILNDPERRHAGPDEAEVGGQVYLRGDDEPRSEFDARLRAAAIAAGQQVICVSLAAGPDEGPFLDDFALDVQLGETIEICGGDQ